MNTKRQNPITSPPPLSPLQACEWFLRSLHIKRLGGLSPMKDWSDWATVEAVIREAVEHAKA